MAAAAALGSGAARAQYYDWGQDPATTRWRIIKTRDFRYIFPDTYGKNAVRIMHYMDTVRPQIAYGFTHGPLKRIPVIMHTRNFNPNGIMMLAPKRMELIVTPDAQQFAFPALKQLSVHEYRHAVQYNNLNQGVIKVLSRLLGQQGMMVGLAFMPAWAMEGDAVLAETQMSTFGRGLQPSFSIEYRAMALEGKWDRFPMDKFFCGSFKDYMPNHYQLGYQILSWADDHYGENILDKTSRFSARNPYMIASFALALEKYYGTRQKKLFNESFAAMAAYWRTLPLEDDTARIIETPVTSYTTYAYARFCEYFPDDDPGPRIIALKSDLDRTYRLVAVNPETGEERMLCRTGYVNSPLSVGEGHVFWTEYRQSTFWAQRVNSQLCSYDMATGRRRTHPEYRNVLFPLIVPSRPGEQSLTALAAVEYSIDGTYTIKKYRGSGIPGTGFADPASTGEPAGEVTARKQAPYALSAEEWSLPDTISVHGLAYEKSSDKLYFIGLSDGGMWIGSVEEGREGFRPVTRPGYTTVANLTVGDGVLYFNSIGSGKDEVHMYDLAAGKEYRVTTSRYGSFSPSEMSGFAHGRDAGVAMTTYTSGGYLLSRQQVDRRALVEVPYAKVPQNVVNPPRRKWPVMNMDDVTVGDTTRREVRKYRKGLNLFNFHSWAPVSYEPDRIMSESQFDIMLGVTVMSQNNLNSAYTAFSYGWTGSNNVLRGKFNYSGWAPKLELEARWSDEKQHVARPSDVDPPPKPGDCIELTGRVYVPFLLSSGANFRTLFPSVEYQYNNAKFYDYGKEDFTTGLHKVIFGLQYSENRRMAYRDFLPRFGYAARVNYAVDPFNDEFGKLWSAYGRLYLPGLAQHHSLMLRGAYQFQKDGTYAFRQKEIFPRGADWDAVAPRRYAAVSVDYQFPVWCPDGGINSLIYFRRIRINPGADFARFKNYWTRDRGAKWHNLWSYGGDIVFDIAPLRLPSNTSMTVTISIRKPGDSKNIWAGFSLSMPI